MPLLCSSRTVILFAKKPATKPPFLHEQNGGFQDQLSNTSQSVIF
jgi:hypothetical protein